ncbi:unnamed protein product, partial [Prorocentrum cordatum]
GVSGLTRGRPASRTPPALQGWASPPRTTCRASRTPASPWPEWPGRCRTSSEPPSRPPARGAWARSRWRASRRSAERSWTGRWPQPRGSADPRPRELTRHVLRAGSAEAAADWARRINDAARTGGRQREASGGRPRRLLCVVNPRAGRGRGVDFRSEAAPVLEAAGVQFTLQETRAAGEATTIAREADLGEVDGIVVCGGDGTFHEVVSGLVARPDAKDVCSRLPLSHVPAGSGNAIAFNVAAACDESACASSAAYIAVKGSPKPMDAGCAWDRRGVPQPLVLMVEWALIADIDFESEWMRGCCGGLRFQLEAVKQIICLRRYGAQLDYLPEDAERDAGFARSAPDEFFGIFAPTSADVAGPPRSSLLPPASAFAEAPPEGWSRLEGNFNLCVGMLATWIDAGSTPMAPDHRMGGGAMTLIHSLELSRWEVMSGFLAIDNARHLEDGRVRASRVRALRLKPDAAAPAAIGVDGEMVTPAGEDRLLEVVVYPAVLRLCLL